MKLVLIKNLITAVLTLKFHDYLLLFVWFSVSFTGALLPMCICTSFNDMTKLTIAIL